MSRSVKLLFLFTPLVPLTGSSQQIEIKGTISIHNSKYETGEIEYVQDAYIYAAFATPQVSDGEGKFTLSFVGIGKGSLVELAVQKSNLEVVNRKDLQQVVLGRKMPIKIYLSPKGKLAQSQTELYKISRNALFAHRDSIVRQLYGEEKESKLVMATLAQKLSITIANKKQAEEILNRRVLRLERQLPKYALHLSRVNLDFASDLYIRAFEYFKAGKIEKTIEILDEAVLEDSYQKAKKTQTRANELVQTGDSLVTLGKLAKDTLELARKLMMLSIKRDSLSNKKK